MESHAHREPSRIGTARARAASAKQALLASALALFFAVSVHRFASMGCEIVVGGTTTAARAIERLFAERDRMFSRFRHDSELSRVNRASGQVVSVSAPFAQLVEHALRAAASTDGIVDPT